MTDSQSRYSIVERLTEKKLGLIREKSQLDELIKRKSQEAEEAKKVSEDFKKDAKLQVEQKQRELVRSHLRAVDAFSNAKQNKNIKENAINEQIKAVEEALKKIEAISKDAGKEQQL